MAIENSSLRFAIILATLTVTALSASAQQPQPLAGTGLVTELPAQEFYRRGVLQAVHLEIEPKNLEQLHAALPNRVYVPATFRWNNVTVNHVAVRFKGNSSSNPRQRHKRSFLVKFDAFDKKQRFLGLQRVSFDNGIQFGSVFSEPIITGILRKEGIRAHRCNYTKLYINQKYMGVYVNVERIDDTFLASRWPGKKGPLYKNDLGGPGGNLQYIGLYSKNYEKAFEAKTKAASKHRKELIAWIRTINHAPQAEIDTRLESSMDIDRFLKVMAVMLMSGAFDQLTGWNHHNYYLYQTPDDNRWHYLPWDLDVGFAETAFQRLRIIDEWNAAWPVTPSPCPLLERIVKSPKLLSRYRKIASAVLEKHFEPTKLEKALDSNYALIKSALADDPFPHTRVTNPRDTDYDSIVASIKNFIRRRYQTANSQLKDPGPRPRFAHEEPVEPQPGRASQQDPSDLRLVSNDQGGIVLAWKDNAKGEAGHLIQRAVGKNGEFRNFQGRPGMNSTRGHDDRTESGKIYRYRVFAVFPSREGPRGSGVSNTITVLAK